VASVGYLSHRDLLVKTWEHSLDQLGPGRIEDLGAVDIALHTARDALEQAAAEIDADPADRKQCGWRRALRVRALVEATATEVMARPGAGR
jgi:hypothetical protein